MALQFAKREDRIVRDRIAHFDLPHEWSKNDAIRRLVLNPSAPHDIIWERFRSTFPRFLTSPSFLSKVPESMTPAQMETLVDKFVRYLNYLHCACRNVAAVSGLLASDPEPMPMVHQAQTLTDDIDKLELRQRRAQRQGNRPLVDKLSGSIRAKQEDLNKIDSRLEKAFWTQINEKQVGSRQWWSTLQKLKVGRSDSRSVAQVLDIDKAVQYWSSFWAATQGQVDSGGHVTRRRSQRRGWDVPRKAFSSFDDQDIRTRLISFFNSRIPNSSPGPDGFTNRFIKFALSAGDSCLVLARIVYMMIRNGYFPVSWRSGRITLIHKGDDPSDPANWRPITMCSCLGKAMEYVLCNILHSGIDLHPSQSGFTRGRGVEDNIFTLHHLISFAQNENLPFGLLNLDIQKAFDSVDHATLLSVLRDRAVPDNVLNTIASFLKSSRYIHCSSFDVRSQSFKIGRGVPQGGVLSPLLFIIFLDDTVRMLHYQRNVILNPTIRRLDGVSLEVQQHMRRIGCLAYADDLSIPFYSVCELRQLASFTNDFLGKYGLSINFKKSSFFCTNMSSDLRDAVENGHAKSDDGTGKMCVIVDGTAKTSIVREKSFRYLGVQFSKKTGSTHAAARVAKLAKAEFAWHPLIKASRRCTWPVRLTFFKALLRPVLEFGLGCLELSDATLTSLERSHSILLRRVFGQHRKCPIETLLLELDLPTVRQRHRLLCLKTYLRLGDVGVHPLTGSLLPLLLKYSSTKDNGDVVGQLNYIQRLNDSLNRHVPSTKLPLKLRCRGTDRKELFLSCWAHTHSLRDYNRRILALDDNRWASTKAYRPRSLLEGDLLDWIKGDHRLIRSFDFWMQLRIGYVRLVRACPGNLWMATDTERFHSSCQLCGSSDQTVEHLFFDCSSPLLSGSISHLLSVVRSCVHISMQSEFSLMDREDGSSVCSLGAEKVHLRELLLDILLGGPVPRKLGWASLLPDPETLRVRVPLDVPAVGYAGPVDSIRYRLSKSILLFCYKLWSVLSASR
jgi:hypothetical protein